MSAVNEILNSVPIDQLAAELGTDEATARSAAAEAANQLLGGLAQNAQSGDGELSLASALSDHGRDNTLLDSGSVDLSQVDTADGDKILGHVFQDTDAVALAGAQQAAGGVNQDMMMKVMKLLAPIVLAYLAKNLQNGKYGDILGNILGGGAGGGQAEPQGGGGGILGQILGGILGGGAGGGLGSILGGGEQQQAPTQTSQPAGDGGGFQAPSNTGDGGLRMDDGNDDASGQQSQQSQQQGGVFGDILGKIFGR